MFCNSCGKELSIPSEPCPNCGTLNTSSGQHRSADALTGIVSHVGLVIDERYRIDSKLGSGGMATVYRATRLLIGDTVAIKILHADQVRDPQSAERFRREAQAAARLKHPNAVTIYDFGVSADGLIYLVMELVEGKSVRAMIREQGPLPPTTAAEILRQACAALEEAHKQNIVHRDVKPDNIVVAVTPTGLRVKVLDFGIARMRDIVAANITQTGSVMGTPHYMSPEQCLGEELDSRSDIYSLGVVLFEMLAGVVPFNSPTSSAVIIQHVNQAPPPLRVINISVPPAIEAVVLRALSKRREDRQQSAQLLAEELNKALGGNVASGNADISARDGLTPTMKMSMPDWSGATQPPQLSGHQASRSQRPWTLMAGAGVPLLAVAGWFLYASSKAADSSESAQPESASAQFSQQGPKLLGSGAIGNGHQGSSVSISADGNSGPGKVIIPGSKDEGAYIAEQAEKRRLAIVAAEREAEERRQAGIRADEQRQLQVQADIRALESPDCIEGEQLVPEHSERVFTVHPARKCWTPWLVLGNHYNFQIKESGDILIQFSSMDGTLGEAFEDGPGRHWQKAEVIRSVRFKSLGKQPVNVTLRIP